MAENHGKGFFAGLMERFRRPSPKQEETTPEFTGDDNINISSNNLVKELPLGREEELPSPEEPVPEASLPEASLPEASLLEKLTPAFLKKSKASPETNIPQSSQEEVPPAPVQEETATKMENIVPEVQEPIKEDSSEKDSPPSAESTPVQREDPVSQEGFLDKITPAFLKKDKATPEALPTDSRHSIEDSAVSMPEKKAPAGWFQRLRQGLDKTRKSLVFKVKGLLRLRNVIDEDFWEELEDILITADVGLKTTDHIVSRMREEVEEKLISEPAHLFEVMKEELCRVLEQKDTSLHLESGGLSVIMVVGVNGTGKTTSIAKLANRLTQQGRKVIIAAADTFRAAAIEQLEVWSKRLDLDLIKHREGADPAAVVFDGVEAARARGADVLIVDTAGRLHSKVNLMKELEKIKRVIEKQVPGALRETLLVLDATTGQNALIQAKTFRDFVDLSGIVLTKLDGTAKGGVIIGIVHEMGIPVKFIGIGEGIYDLRPFESRDFLEALFSDNDREEERESQ